MPSSDDEVNGTAFAAHLPIVARRKMDDAAADWPMATSKEIDNARYRLHAARRAEIAERATGVEMRMLHEDVISRLALLPEGQTPRPKRKPKSRKKS